MRFCSGGRQATVTITSVASDPPLSPKHIVDTMLPRIVALLRARWGDTVDIVVEEERPPPQRWIFDRDAEKTEAVTVMAASADGGLLRIERRGTRAPSGAEATPWQERIDAREVFDTEREARRHGFERLHADALEEIAEAREALEEAEKSLGRYADEIKRTDNETEVEG